MVRPGRAKVGSVRCLAGRLRRERSGQALVEFAIVAPLIVMVMLFAIWCWEIITIKLKTQEAARFATWEATAYPLHDYEKGRGALLRKGMSMRARVISRTAGRYADLDSSTFVPRGNSLIMASWTPPVVAMLNGPEELVYGGYVVNMIFGLGARVFDLISAMRYRNANPVAEALIRSGKNRGGARTARIFGAREWGFNRNGLIRGYATTYVKNNWFNTKMLFWDDKSGKLQAQTVFGDSPLPGMLIIEKNALLADSWKLHKGEDAYGGSSQRRGHSSTAFYKQVDRMYFGRRAARMVAKGFISGFYATMTAALAAAGMTPSAGISLGDFDKPAVVSRNYGTAFGGKALIREDLGYRRYDTAPNNGEYAKTLRQRGDYFMGCRQAEKLGCTDTLSQDNPFGDYLVRE